MQTKLTNGLYMMTVCNSDKGLSSNLVRYRSDGTYFVVGTIIYTTDHDKSFNTIDEQHRAALRAYA